MSADIIKKMSQKFIVDERESSFSVGDRVVVHFKIVEGSVERIQLIEGIVLTKKSSGVHSTFTVRKISSGIGVERIFPLHSPRIEKIVVLRRGKVRKSKLYYMRDRIGKAAMKIKEKF